MSIARETRADGRRGLRTREEIIEALREYAETHGDAFTAAAFSPSAAKWNDRPELVERYYAGRSDGRPWPSLNSIKDAFGGSFNAAREAAGLRVNRPGPRNRRPAGEHEPIRTVRERLVYVPDERLSATYRSKLRAEERADRAVARADRLAEQLAEARARPVRERVVRERPATRTTTKTKTIRVRDERREARLRERLEDETVRKRAIQDQLNAATDEVERLTAARHRAEAEVAEAALRAARSDAEARRASEARDRAEDRVAALEARVGDLLADLEDARTVALGAAEAAAEADLVRRAEVRALAAEARATRAEREMAEQGAAITGETRRLTVDELDELRRDGPAGEVLLARALKLLATARRNRGDLDAALTRIAEAAVNWRDRLSR